MKTKKDLKSQIKNKKEYIMRKDAGSKNKTTAVVINPYYVFKEDITGDCAEINCDTEECGKYPRCEGCNCIPENKEKEN